MYSITASRKFVVAPLAGRAVLAFNDNNFANNNANPGRAIA
jgi:hypothetical protein